MKRITRVALDSYFDGFTGAGLFGPLRRPGAPTEFVDSRDMQWVGKIQELQAGGKLGGMRTVRRELQDLIGFHPIGELGRKVTAALAVPPIETQIEQATRRPDAETVESVSGKAEKRADAEYEKAG